jgi:hypothetical protein
MFQKLKSLLVKEARADIREWQDPQEEENPMSCQEITIEGIGKDFYGQLLAEASAAGGKFEGTKASIGGCEFNWSYDAETQGLHITCIKKPFYASCDTVESKIRELVAKAKESV